MRRSSRITGTGGTGDDEDVTEGRVSGAVLRAVRDSTGSTQERLAEHLDVAVETVRGWERGRRPLARMRIGRYHRLRRRLQQLRPDVETLALLDKALNADVLLTELADGDVCPGEHPLATQVTDRELTDLLAWPITGRPPRVLRGRCVRGPLLGEGERDELAGSLRGAVERADGAASASMLRRQTAFLLAGHEPSASWLDDLARQEARSAPDLSRWSPRWPVARSLAVSRAMQGDTEPLQAFITHGLADADTQLAHLRYWAYWVGEIPGLWEADEQMAEADGTRWTGDVLARALIDNLTPEVPYRDLAAHALWSLYQHKRDLADDPELTSRFIERHDQITSHANTLTADSRQRLDQVRYAARR